MDRDAWFNSEASWCLPGPSSPQRTLRPQQWWLTGHGSFPWVLWSAFGTRSLDPSGPIWLSMISALQWSLHLPWDKHLPPCLANILIRFSQIEPRQLHTVWGCRLWRIVCKASHLGFCTKVRRCCWVTGDGSSSPLPWTPHSGRSGGMFWSALTRGRHTPLLLPQSRFQISEAQVKEVGDF